MSRLAFGRSVVGALVLGVEGARFNSYDRQHLNIKLKLKKVIKAKNVSVE